MCKLFYLQVRSLAVPGWTPAAKAAYVLEEADLPSRKAVLNNQASWFILILYFGMEFSMLKRRRAIQFTFLASVPGRYCLTVEKAVLVILVLIYLTGTAHLKVEV